MTIRLIVAITISLSPLLAGVPDSTSKATKPLSEIETLLVAKKIPLIVPVKGMSSIGFLTRSILHRPRDLVRDGLPWFGTKRDDWLPGKLTRSHKGIDIYADTILVIAPAPGVVEKVGRSSTAGKYLKIDHGGGVKTVYVHLSRILVEQQTRLKCGAVLAKTDRPEGNAIDTQLHFELEIDGKKVDPIPLIQQYSKKPFEERKLISQYLKVRDSLAVARDFLVQKGKNSQAQGNRKK